MLKLDDQLKLKGQSTEVANKAIIVFHQGQQHSRPWTDFIKGIVPAHTAIFDWNVCRHGCSGGRNDFESFSTSVKDADIFVHSIVTKYHIPIENIIVVGHSRGASIVATWVHDYAPRIRSMVLMKACGTPKRIADDARAGAGVGSICTTS